MSTLELLGFALFQGEATIRPYHGIPISGDPHTMVVTIECREYLLWQGDTMPADHTSCNTELRLALIEIHDSYVDAHRQMEEEDGTDEATNNSEHSKGCSSLSELG